MHPLDERIAGEMRLCGEMGRLGEAASALAQYTLR